MHIIDQGNRIVALIERLIEKGQGMTVRFQGSAEERQANYRTHQWSGPLTDHRCFNCDARPGSEASFWPCGQEPFSPLPRLAAPYDLIDRMAEEEEREPGGLT